MYVLTARSHLLFRTELGFAASRFESVNVTFLSNYNKYLNHKYFMPQCSHCWTL